VSSTASRAFATAPNGGGARYTTSLDDIKKTDTQEGDQTSSSSDDSSSSSSDSSDSEDDDEDDDDDDDDTSSSSSSLPNQRGMRIPYSTDGRSFDLSDSALDSLLDSPDIQHRVTGWSSEAHLPQSYVVIVDIHGHEEESLTRAVNHVLRCSHLASTAQPRHLRMKPKRTLLTVPAASFKYKKERMKQYWIVDRQHRITMTCATKRTAHFLLHSLRHTKFEASGLTSVEVTVRHPVPLDPRAAENPR